MYDLLQSQLDVGDPNGPQRYVHLQIVLEGEQPVRFRRLVQVARGQFQLPVDCRHFGGLPTKAEPGVDGADHGAKARQLVFEDDADKMTQRTDAGLVHAFEDGLPQTLLPLRGQQQFFYDFPVVGGIG